MPVPTSRRRGALKAKLSSLQIAARSVGLKDMAEKGVDAVLGPDADTAVVAVGRPAALWLHKQLPANVSLAYCMVADPAQIGLTDGPRGARGVSTDVPLANQFSLIAEALPQARTVGMLYRSDSPDGQRLMGMVKASAAARLAA